jgi:hypothetical protein
LAKAEKIQTPAKQKTKDLFMTDFHSPVIFSSLRRSLQGPRK